MGRSAMLLTWQDATERLLDYLGSTSSTDSSTLRDCKQSCIEALRDLTQSHDWSYLYAHGRIVTSASYITGTIQYQGSGGTYPYQVTLTGGTWPTWAALGTLRVDNINCDVAQRISGSIVTLNPPIVPIEDVEALASFAIYQD